jgi:hypothetical protein
MANPSPPSPRDPEPPVDSSDEPVLTEAAKKALRGSMYWRGQVLPRLDTMGKSPVLWLPVLSGLIVPWIVSCWVSIDTPISDVAGTGMNYAAIGFGACITGAVLGISLPGPGRVNLWAKIETTKGFSGYSDLVFALTWAALAQLGVVVVCILVIIVGGDEHLLPLDPKEEHLVLLGISLAIFLYAVVQLLVLVQTISQLGNLIDFQARQEDSAAD